MMVGDGALVVDDLTIAQDPAVSVIGVLAHADVGDRDDPGDLTLERAQRLLDGAFVVPRRGSRRILRVRDPEEHDTANPRLTPFPDRTKSGRISCDGCSRVSRTRLRNASVRRRRRGRYSGNVAMREI